MSDRLIRSYLCNGTSSGYRGLSLLAGAVSEKGEESMTLGELIVRYKNLKLLRLFDAALRRRLMDKETMRALLTEARARMKAKRMNRRYTDGR